MSKDIPVLGKIWLCILFVLAAAGVIANLIGVGNGIIYLISAIACAAEVYGLFFLLKGNGAKYYLIYAAGYLVNVVITTIPTVQAGKASVSYCIGLVLGLCINLGLTYLSAKKTLDFSKIK